MGQEIVQAGAATPALLSGGTPAAIVPRSLEDAYRIAKAVVSSGLAPKGLETVEKCLVAVMHGLEVGLPPMTALQRIAVVNGRPTLWGDAAIGLVRASGACEYIRERIEGEGDKQTAICEAKRRGETEPIVGTFSVADAKRAGLWGKSGPWTQYPARMLKMRARAFALRDGFADVLGGLYLREEIEDGGAHVAPAVAPPVITARDVMHNPQTGEVVEVPIVNNAPIVVRGAPPVAKPNGKASPMKAPAVKAAPEPAADMMDLALPSPDAVLGELEQRLADCGDASELELIEREAQEDAALKFPADWAKAKALIDAARERIG